MKKKILALLLAVVMLVGMMPLSMISAADYERDPDGDGDYFVFKLEDKTINSTDAEVSVNLDILENTGVYAMKYYLIYDKDLTFKNVAKADPCSFPDFVESDVGSKDQTNEWMSGHDYDWDWMLENLGWNQADFDNMNITTVYSECIQWYDYSDELGTICTFTFDRNVDSELEEHVIQLVPVWGNYIRNDPESPNADDEGIVEIYDPVGLPSVITVEFDKDDEDDEEPVYTEPTIIVSDAEIAIGTETADFTLTVVNNPGLYAFYGYIGYDEAMSLAAFENGEVFADSELVLKGPMNNEIQRDIVAATDKKVQKAYNDHGASTEGVLASQVYYEAQDLEANNENNGVIATFSLNTATLAAGEYDITFYYTKNSTTDVDFENVAFDLVHGKLTVITCAHEFVQDGEPVPATCTDDGYTNYVCSKCGESEKRDIVDALGHNYETEVTEPTCAVEGYTTYTCSVCGHNYKDNFVEVIDHSYEAAVTEPTCTEGGYTTYTCSVCGDEYVEDETEALGHDWTVTGTTGTCGEVGKTNFECTVCGETKEEDGEVIQHNYEGKAGTDATCTEDGEEISECTICGDVKTTVLPALGHDYEAVVTDPDCLNGGYTTYTCTRCGDSYVDDETEALGHDYIENVTLEPTCTEEGSKDITCSRCDYEATEAIDALGHDYEAVVTEPTCTEGGYTTYTCANGCGDSYVADETEALGHDYKAVVTEPTCTEGGYTTYTCANGCGDSYVADETEALGHDYEAVVTEPTCTEDGYTTHTCSVCGDSYVDSEVEAFGHDYAEEVTEATCTEKGYTTHTCAVCGDTYNDEFVDALGHDEVVETVEPTCTEAGSKHTTCTRCDLDETEVLEALGHDLVDSEVVDATCTEAGSKHEACTRCDYEADVEIEALGHKWDNGVVTKEPTSLEEGEKTYTCEVCKETKVEKLEKLPEVNPQDKEDNKEDNKEEDKSHQTGDNMMMFVFVALIAVVSAAGVMFSKKKLFARK